MLLALAVLFSMAACAPRTYEDCKTEAAKNSTDKGVQFAVQACYEKFEVPRKAAELKAAKERSERVSKAWSNVRNSRTMESVKALVGEPDESGPTQCALGAEKAPSRCIEHRWNDARYPGACKSVSTELFPAQAHDEGFCKWRLQATLDGSVWATYPDPM